MKLNLGSGYRRLDGFLNVDCDPLTEPDILMDFENDRFPIQDNSVDEIIAHHVFEHIGEGYFDFLKELYRICKNGCVLDIKFPHYRSDLQWMDPSHKRVLMIDQFLLFSKKYNEEHKNLWNSSSGFGVLLDIDFEVLKFKHNPRQKWEDRFKTMTEEEITEISENYSNVFFETHIILKAVK